MIFYIPINFIHVLLRKIIKVDCFVFILIWDENVMFVIFKYIYNRYFKTHNN
jgi:hypothetical protein